MRILDIFLASFLPVLKVLFLTVLGLFLALQRVDILGAEASKHLNNVAFFVFSPSLIASSLANNLTVKSIGILWFMPLNILLTFIVGSALGWILVKITRTPRDLWGLIIGCCAAGNLGNMPMIIIPAVCKERDHPFGNADVCYNQGIAYSSLSMAMPFLTRIKQCFQTFASKLNLRKVFAPSTIGAIIGFMVGGIPQLRKVLIGDSAPLRVVQDTTSLLGGASIPTESLIVGANLLRGLKRSRIHLSIIVGIIVIRYIILPILGVCIVKGAIHFGLVNSDHKLYQFLLLLQFAVPPAISIGTMTQLHGAGEGECSVIMLWTYILASVSLTLWSIFFMWFVG
ncbi:hypothetical protein Q3G72_006121 [Acer saccharum]|nr:hypothetical protein Q3G72_006121 [Acer saccharum]